MIKPRDQIILPPIKKIKKRSDIGGKIQHLRMSRRFSEVKAQ